MSNPASETRKTLERAAQGDSSQWSELLARYRQRLRRMVALRMDRRLLRRIDASDVIQEACCEAWTRLAEYLRTPTMPFFLWLRFLTAQRLATLHRKHLAVRMRNLGVEISLHRGSVPESGSAALATQLLANETGPSEAAVRAEMKVRVQQALNSMDAMDREVLALRHFEQLSRGEVAHRLQIRESAVSKRYMRASKRLKERLSTLPGGPSEFRI